MRSSSPCSISVSQNFHPLRASPSLSTAHQRSSAPIHPQNPVGNKKGNPKSPHTPSKHLPTVGLPFSCQPPDPSIYLIPKQIALAHLPAPFSKIEVEGKYKGCKPPSCALRPFLLLTPFLSNILLAKSLESRSCGNNTRQLQQTKDQPKKQGGGVPPQLSKEKNYASTNLPTHPHQRESLWLTRTP